MLRSLWSEKDKREKSDFTIVDKVLSAFWYARVMTKQIDRINTLVRFVQYQKNEATQREIEQIINACIATNDLKRFREYVSQFLSPEDAMLIDNAQGLNVRPKGQEVQVLKINTRDKTDLAEYLTEEKVSASIFIGNAHQRIEQGDTILSNPEDSHGFSNESFNGCFNFKND
jgi:hypothetical protein